MNPLLICCAKDELDLVAGSKTSHFYQKGQSIFLEGDEAMGLHCVHHGKIKVIKTGGDGKEQITRLAKQGDVLGFRSLLTHSGYTTSAVALDDCVVCVLPRPDFLRLVQSNAQFANALLLLLAQDLGHAEEQMLHLAYKPVRERLAAALLLLRRTFQQPREAVFSIAFAREDLAALVGTAKETVSRLLTEFKDAGLIATRGSQITILSPARLLEISSLYD